MKQLKTVGPALVVAMALVAFMTSSASATTLEIKGVKQATAATVTVVLAPGTSMTLKDEAGTTTDTCTTSEVHGKTTEFTTPGTNEIHGNIEKLTFGNCSHTTHVIKPGKFYIGWAGGTLGTVTLAESEFQVYSTFFGATATCKTGAGTKVGPLTGVSSGKATIHINSIISCGILGNSAWTGTYTVSSPEGLGVVE